MHKNSCIIITQNVQLTSSFHPTYHHLPSYGNRKHSILHFCPCCNHRGFSHHEKTGQLPCQIHRTAYHHRRSHLHLFQLLHSGIVALKHTITKPDKHLTRASWSTCRHATELSLKAIQPNRLTIELYQRAKIGWKKCRMRVEKRRFSTDKKLAIHSFFTKDQFLKNKSRQRSKPNTFVSREKVQNLAVRD